MVCHVWGDLGELIELSKRGIRNLFLDVNGVWCLHPALNSCQGFEECHYRPHNVWSEYTKVIVIIISFLSFTELHVLDRSKRRITLYYWSACHGLAGVGWLRTVIDAIKNIHVCACACACVWVCVHVCPCVSMVIYIQFPHNFPSWQQRFHLLIHDI